MSLAQFDNKKYLNLETTRKNGQIIKTPVWFSKDGDTLLVWTDANSGKVKRIRRDGKVRVVPSTASGEPLGEWVNATAVLDPSPQAVEYLSVRFKKKYGMMFSAFNLFGRVRGSKNTTLRIHLE